MKKISWETIIEDVKKFISFKDFIIKSNNENQINLNLNINNDIDDIKNNENTIIKGLIKQITNKASSIISLNENNNDEKMTNKIFNLIKNITFIIYNNEKENKRIISKGLLNLRNLWELKIIDTYAMPIYYSYPLFRSNILGNKIGLIVVVTFRPMEDKFYIDMIFEINGKETTIFSQEKHTSFNDIIDNINKILRKVYYLLMKMILFNQFLMNMKQTLKHY